jgi:hypothetical protein
MRTLILLIFLMLLFQGCKYGGPVMPNEKPNYGYTIVSFYNFIQYDSLTVYLDGAPLIKFNYDTTLRHGTSGIEFRSQIGLHIFTVRLPSEKIQGSAYFISSENFSEIDVYYDSRNRTITSRVLY